MLVTQISLTRCIALLVDIISAAELFIFVSNISSAEKGRATELAPSPAGGNLKSAWPCLGHRVYYSGGRVCGRYGRGMRSMGEGVMQ